MAQFTYIDSEERVYPYITVNGVALVATPNTTYDLDTNPADGRWVTATTPAPVAPEAPVTAPEAPVTAATDPTAPTTPAN